MNHSQVINESLLGPDDIRRFRSGTHYELHKKFGSLPGTVAGVEGRYFSVWAPNATAVSVIGDFNNWRHDAHPLFLREDDSGIWQGFIGGCQPGQLYKYHIKTVAGIAVDKGDPFANSWELRPKTASVISALTYEWQDALWMTGQQQNNALDGPWSVYEVHLLSWMRPDKHDENSINTYQQAIGLLVPYVKHMGFTHVELMPITEHPNDASWGYQGTGFFAPSSRFGTPVEFMQLIDAFHQAGIGVILDWVPSHFPYDAHGLYMFDGTHTYEYSDMRKGYHPDWHSYIFDYGKPEVKSFLTSSARFWLDVFHADGLRVDGVSSILILSYSRGPGQWEPNKDGGDSNLEAIKLLQDLNEMVRADFPGVQIIAEESTAWAGVTGPVKKGGLGFSMKWMMGWMHDTLEFFQLGQQERLQPERLDKFRLSMNYYYDEKFMLALSHDEVVYGKKPLLLKMPGKTEQQFANLRLLFTYMFTHPGAKLLFMGDEFGSSQEWNFKSELPWELMNEPMHQGISDCVRDLNLLLRNEPALYEKQFAKTGFEWMDLQPATGNMIAYRRKGKLRADDLVVVLNLGNETGVITLPVSGNNKWTIVFNSNAVSYGGNAAQYGGERNNGASALTQKNNDFHIAVAAFAGLIIKKQTSVKLPVAKKNIQKVQETRADYLKKKAVKKTVSKKKEAKKTAIKKGLKK